MILNNQVANNRLFIYFCTEQITKFMRKIWNLSMAVMLLITISACSGDEPEVTDEPVERQSFYLLSSTPSQFIVYSESTDGYLSTTKYDNGYTVFDVENGDVITVVCMVGEELLPTVSYRIGNWTGEGEVKTLYSSPNTSNHFGFRLMRTQDGQDSFTVQY